MRILNTLLAAGALAGLAGGALAQSADDLRHSAGNGDVLTHGMGYGLQRFSTLTQINKDTVRRLVPPAPRGGAGAGCRGPHRPFAGGFGRVAPGRAGLQWSAPEPPDVAARLTPAQFRGEQDAP